MSKNKGELGEVYKNLENMGYRNLFVWEDSPGTFYDWHTHPNDEIRYVLEGEVVIKVNNGQNVEEYYLGPGQFLEVKANIPHNAYTKTGVKYVCGSK